MSSRKIKELQDKRKKTQDKLKHLYLNFRGVRHENSSDEMKYIQIKVLEGFVASIDREIKTLEKENKK